MTSPFIWEMMSRSCGAGIELSVLEMASGHVRPAGMSAPGGRGGSKGVCCA